MLSPKLACKCSITFPCMAAKAPDKLILYHGITQFARHTSVHMVQSYMPAWQIEPDVVPMGLWSVLLPVLGRP